MQSKIGDRQGVRIKQIAVEAGIPDYWKKYTGLDGKELGVNNFGESAPAKAVFDYFGLTEPNLIHTVNELLTS